MQALHRRGETARGKQQSHIPHGQAQVTSLGGPPIVVTRIEGEVALTRPDAASLKVTALDFNGYPRQAIDGGAKRIALLPDCLYYVLAK